MKPSEIKKLAEKEYAKYFALAEYFPDPKKADFYCKKRTEEITIGLYPSLRQRFNFFGNGVLVRNIAMTKQISASISSILHVEPSLILRAVASSSRQP